MPYDLEKARKIKETSKYLNSFDLQRLIEKSKNNAYINEEGHTCVKLSLSFEGSVNNYSWKHQLNNYTRIQEVLKRNGTGLLAVASATYPADRGKLTCFVSISQDGKIVWYKYEGWAVGGGSNHIYINGLKMKLTDFLAGTKEQQDSLFR